MSATYAYYPGCSSTASGRAYEASTQAVAKALGLELRELPDWNCCGATAYPAVRELSGHVLNARNLALAERASPGADLVTPCTACYANLSKANKALHADPRIRDAVDRSLAAGGLRYGGEVRPRHLLQVLVEDVGVEAIRARVVRPLTGVKVAPYYGCQLVRPFTQGEDPNHPTSLDRLLEALGAEVVPYPPKTWCCGGMLIISSEDTALGLVREILLWAAARQADCLTTICPLCYVNLEAHQGKLIAGRGPGDGASLPVSYFTQLVGLALGLSPRQLGVGSELVPLTGIVGKLGGPAERGAESAAREGKR